MADRAFLWPHPALSKGEGSMNLWHHTFVEIRKYYYEVKVYRIDITFTT